MPDELTEYTNISIEEAVGGMYRLYVDGHLLTERDYTGPITEESVLKLEPGEHEMRVEFAESQNFKIRADFTEGKLVGQEQDHRSARVKFKIEPSR